MSSAALSEADFISVHCVLNETTRHLMGAAEMARLKPSAILINVSRVGLNEAHTQALVYIGVAAWTGADRAGGEYVLLRKRSGSWSVGGRAKKWDMGPK